MSDGAAAAPAEAPAAEPTEGTEVVAKPEGEKPPPKPRTIDDDLEDVFAKHKTGATYKAGGKEKAAKSWAEAKRVLSFADGANEAADRAAKQVKEADGLKAKLAAVAKLRPAERLNALKEAGIDPQVIREAVEESILDEDEKQKAQAHLSPREREYEAKLREREEELTHFRTQQEAAKREQEEAAYVERVTQTGERLNKATLGALQKAKITGEHAPRFLQAIADKLDRNERLGLGLDEDDLAEVVMKEHESLADNYYGGLGLDALSAKLEGAMMDDPDRPGVKVSRLKLLMRHEAAKIRARQNGTGAPVVGGRSSTVPPAAGANSVSDLDFWRRR